MSIASEELLALITTFNQRLTKLLAQREVKASTPAPPEIESPAKPGVISMGDLIRSIPKKKPPRAPGMQVRRFNGSWPSRRHFLNSLVSRGRHLDQWSFSEQASACGDARSRAATQRLKFLLRFYKQFSQTISR
jgi:hypothetical protein